METTKLMTTERTGKVRLMAAKEAAFRVIFKVPGGYVTPWCHRGDPYTCTEVVCLMTVEDMSELTELKCEALTRLGLVHVRLTCRRSRCWSLMHSGSIHRSSTVRGWKLDEGLCFWAISKSTGVPGDAPGRMDV